MAQAILVYSESPLNHALIWQNISVSAFVLRSPLWWNKFKTLILKPVQKGLLPLLRRKIMYCNSMQHQWEAPLYWPAWVATSERFRAPPSILFLECKWRHATHSSKTLHFYSQKRRQVWTRGFVHDHATHSSITLHFYFQKRHDKYE